MSSKVASIDGPGTDRVSLTDASEACTWGPTPSLRATGDRVLVVRVQDRGQLICHVGEQMGVTDHVLQFGEVVGMGSEWTSGRYRHLELAVGDLVVYPSPRIHDQFRHTLPGKGTVMIAVLPGYWISAVVRGTYIAEHPELREYGALLE